MLFDSIGRTPLLEITQLRDNQKGARVFAKAEFMNPGGSVKDRPAWAIINEGIRSGALTRDKILLDATSGNMGISYALICAGLGYKLALCLPRNVNQERKRILKALGAEIIETDPLLAYEGAVEVTLNIFAKKPRLYFYPDQLNNEENWRSHYNTTGVEIWEQTGGEVSHFVSALGTSGTFVGIAKRLKAFNPQVQGITVQPNTPLHGLEGVRYMHSSTAFSGFYDDSLNNKRVVMSTEEARQTTLLLARKKGLFVGPSSGANVAAALKIAAALPEDNCVVTVLCDTGFRYLSDKLWDALR